MPRYKYFGTAVWICLRLTVLEGVPSFASAYSSSFCGGMWVDGCDETVNLGFHYILETQIVPLHHPVPHRTPKN